MSVLLLLMALVADPQIEALRSQMESMRGRVKVTDGPRGATPELTEVKHRLRDWIEFRLKSFDARGDIREFERALNLELHGAKLTCDDQPCPNEFGIGFLGEVQVSRDSAFLLIQTSFGVQCGYDTSAYVYSWTDEGWRRVWLNEQNKYTKDGYFPQTLHAVLISPYSEVNDYLVLTLGSQPWCISNWHNVYYRVFRLGGDAQSKPLIDRAEYAYLDRSPPIQGSIGHEDFLVEFRAGSIDGGVHNREAIRRFEFTPIGVKRIHPIALRPRTFVEEWIANEWRQSFQWTEDENRRTSLQWHNKLREAHGDFLPTTRCADSSDVWQVGLELPAPVYFQVRWRPRYRFSMVGVSSQPSPKCATGDPDADLDQTLFPVQDWR